MCKATTYQYRCGGAFHIISSCDKQCYADHSYSHASSPDSNGGSLKDHDSTTSLLTSFTGATKAASSTTTSVSSNGACTTGTTGFHSTNNSQHADVDTNNDTTTTSVPTPANPYNPHALPTYRLPPTLRHSKTIIPAYATRVLRAVQQQHWRQPKVVLQDSSLRGWLLSSIITSRWFRRSKDAATRVQKDGDDDEDEVLVVVWQDACEVRRLGVERDAVRVQGECLMCAEREEREAAWAAMATFRGEE